MNPAHDDGHGLDRQARRLHQAALAQVSPQTLMRLRAARHEAAQHAPRAGRAHPWRWLTATAFSAVLAVGLGVQWLPRTPDTPVQPAAPSLAQADSELPTDAFGASGALDEDPDLYLWLASADAQPLAMESTP